MVTGSDKLQAFELQVRRPPPPPSVDESNPSIRQNEVKPKELEVTILSGAGCTTHPNVKLLIHAVDTAEIKISNLPDLSDGEWQLFEPGIDRTQLIDWTLSEGDGEKMVYVMFKAPFLDVVSDVQTAIIQLDETMLCQTAAEHTHSVDIEGKITTTETDPDCLSDYDHTVVEPYVIEEDGTERDVSSLYGQIKTISATSTEYSFETGNNFTYGDVVVHVERIDKDISAHVDVMNALTKNDLQEVRLRIKAADRGVVDDRLLWSREVSSRDQEFYLGGYPELCESWAVPHPHLGDLFRAPSSSIYYYGKDLQRHVFPNKDVFDSWYSESASVETFASYQLANIPLGNNVTLRPGSLACIANQPEVFIVDTNAQLRSFVTNSLLDALYGFNWGTVVHEISAALVTNYFFGAQITSSSELAALSETSTVATIDDLWPITATVEASLRTALFKVLDGRVEFVKDPLHHYTGKTNISFHIFTKDGQPLTAEDLGIQFDQQVRFTLVRDDLTDFYYLHPQEQNGLWTAEADIVESGIYYAYIDIAPIGGQRVILRSVLAIGANPVARTGVPELSTQAGVFLNPFRLELISEPPKATQEFPLAFRLTKDGKAFNGVDPWVNAYGHMSIFDQDNRNAYMHTHAIDPPKDGVLTFLDVRFPYPGRYTMFVQLELEGAMRVFPITIDVPAPEPQVP